MCVGGCRCVWVCMCVPISLFACCTETNVQVFYIMWPALGELLFALRLT